MWRSADFPNTQGNLFFNVATAFNRGLVNH